MTTRSPRPVPRRDGTPRPPSTVSVPDWVPGGIGEAARPSRRRTPPRRRPPRAWAASIVVPSAAAVIGTVTWQSRSVLCRVKTGCVVDVHLDVEVAGRAAAGADLALAGELDPGAGVDAGGDLHRQRAARADPAVAGALPARLGDDRAEAAAGGAGPHRADLAEERALQVHGLAAAAAGLARHRVRPGGRALAVADGAEHGRVDLELVGDAERRLGEVDVEPDQRVLARGVRGAGDRGRSRRPAGTALAAEERVHDVGEREALPGTRAAEAGAVERVAAEVVHPALLGVGEHLVGAGDLLELLLRRPGPGSRRGAAAGRAGGRPS